MQIKSIYHIYLYRHHIGTYWIARKTFNIRQQSFVHFRSSGEWTFSIGQVLSTYSPISWPQNFPWMEFEEGTPFLTGAYRYMAINVVPTGPTTGQKTLLTKLTDSLEYIWSYPISSMIDRDTQFKSVWNQRVTCVTTNAFLFRKIMGTEVS